MEEKEEEKKKEEKDEGKMRTKHPSDGSFPPKARHDIVVIKTQEQNHERTVYMWGIIVSPVLLHIDVSLLMNYVLQNTYTYAKLYI